MRLHASVRVAQANCMSTGLLIPYLDWNVPYGSIEFGSVSIGALEHSSSAASGWK